MKIETICKRTKHLTMGEMPPKGRGILLCMRGNPHFPDAGPMLDQLEVACTAMEQANVDCLNGGRRATAERRACRKAMEASFDKLINYVRYTSQSNVDIALSSGFELRKPPILLPVPERPTALTTVLTRNAGTVLFRWPSMHGVRCYDVYMHTHALENGGEWERVDSTTKAKYTVKGLRRGQFVWLRVCAVASSGTSSMSAPLRAMAA